MPSTSTRRCGLLHLCADDDELELARWMLDRGADPNVRAALRKALRWVADESLHEYREVTPLRWGGAAFHDQDFVNPAVMAMLAARGGQRHGAASSSPAP